MDLTEFDINKMTLELSKDDLNFNFQSENEFRVLAPTAVAQGMLKLCLDPNNTLLYGKSKAYMMDKAQESIPKQDITKPGPRGSTVTASVPLFYGKFTEPMQKEIDAKYKELCTGVLHEKREKSVKEFLKNYKPTIPFNEALYRLSFYLVPNKNNLKSSTRNLISWVKGCLQGRANGMLVDSALLIGGQGKSTLQNGLIRAVKKMGFAATKGRLPSYKDGTQDIYVSSEFVIDDEAEFNNLDIPSLNKILDKSVTTIRGKYVKEWSAPSIANVFVGTNYLPKDINARRYNVRAVSEDFKLTENFGRWKIPGITGDLYGDSYNKVVDWVTEGWINLFYYCNNYKAPELTFEEKSFDYEILYRIKKATENSGTNLHTIASLVRAVEVAEDNTLDCRARESLKARLYALANQLDLEKTDKRKGAYSTYDWTKALEIDETFPEDPLEMVFTYFTEEPAFKEENLVRIEEDGSEETTEIEKNTSCAKSEEASNPVLADTRVSTERLKLVNMLLSTVPENIRSTVMNELRRQQEAEFERIRESV